MAIVEVDDSEDMEDPLLTRGFGLVIAPGSSENWGRSSIDDWVLSRDWSRLTWTQGQ
jgi:hypothetical protein